MVAVVASKPGAAQVRPTTVRGPPSEAHSESTERPRIANFHDNLQDSSDDEADKRVKKKGEEARRRLQSKRPHSQTGEIINIEGNSDGNDDEEDGDGPKPHQLKYYKGIMRKLMVKRNIQYATSSAMRGRVSGCRYFDWMDRESFPTCLHPYIWQQAGK